MNIQYIPKANNKPTAAAVLNPANPTTWTEAARAAFDSVPFDAPDLTPEQLALLEGTTVGNLAQLRQKRRGPTFRKVGRSVRYPRAHYAAYREMTLVQTRW